MERVEMDSSTALALIESIKNLNATIEKISTRLDILENDFKERTFKKHLIKRITTFYPFFLTLLIIVFNIDHNRLTQITHDVSQIIKDSQSITMNMEKD